MIERKTKEYRPTDIPPKVKRIVERRDSVDGVPCCVWCGRPRARGEAHFIPRSQGGMGIPQNILTLCRDCHRKFDGEDRELMKPYLQAYLKRQYPNWQKGRCIYRKFQDSYKEADEQK